MRIFARCIAFIGFCAVAALASILLAQQSIPPFKTTYANFTQGAQINGTYGAAGTCRKSTGNGETWGACATNASNGGLQMVPAELGTGQFINLFPTSCSFSEGGQTQYAAGQCGPAVYDPVTGLTVISGGVLSCIQTGVGLCETQLQFGYTLPGYVSQSAITAAFGFAMSSLVGVILEGAGTFSLGCSGGGTTGNITLSPAAIASYNYPFQTVTQQYGGIPTVTSVTCTLVADTSSNGSKLVAELPSIGLQLNYTGASPPLSNYTNCIPPIACGNGALWLAQPYYYGFDYTNTNNYSIQIPAYAATQTPLTAGDPVLMSIGTSNTSTTVTVSINGGSPITVEACTSTGCGPPAVNQVSSLYINSFLYDGTYLELQGAGGGGGEMVYPGAGVPNSTGTAWGTSYQVGTGANDLIQLNGSSQLPAVSAALLTNFPFTASPPITITPSGGSYIFACPTCGTSTGTSVSVNGTPLGTALLNGTTPAAPSGDSNCTWQVSGSNVSCYVPTSSGGGGGLYNQVMGATPTTSSMGLTVAWNQSGTYSYANTATGVYISDSSTGTGSNYHEGTLETYPGTAYTLTVLATPLPAYLASSSFGPLFEIVIADTLTGPNQVFAVYARSGNWTINVDNNNTPTSYNGSAASQPFSTGVAALWFRVVDAGTTVTFQYSFDQNYWATLLTETKSSSFLGASGFNYLGVGLNTDFGPPGGFGGTVFSWNLNP
jgi:hypothetical protein